MLLLGSEKGRCLPSPGKELGVARGGFKECWKWVGELERKRRT